MLRTFAAALVATALIAGPALAQSNPTATPSAPAAQTTPKAPVASTPAAKPGVTSTKSVKHAAKHMRKHRYSKKTGARHHARHRSAGKARHHPAMKSGVKSDKQS